MSSFGGFFFAGFLYLSYSSFFYVFQFKVMLIYQLFEQFYYVAIRSFLKVLIWLFVQCPSCFHLHSTITTFICTNEFLSGPFEDQNCDVVKQRPDKWSSLTVPQAYHVCLYSLSTQYLVHFETSLGLSSSETMKYFCPLLSLFVPHFTSPSTVTSQKG